MRYLRVFLMLGLVAGLAGAGEVRAQADQTRDGFWFSGGLGYGSLSCNDCFGREGGMSGGLSLGGTISQKVLLGVGTTGWTKEEMGVRLTAATLTALVRFYPSETGGFYLLGGLGLGSVDVQLAGLGGGSETGVGAVLGLGYDFRVSPNASLTPYWNGVGISFDGGDANYGQLGLAITIH